MYVCPAVYVNSSWKWPWETNGALLFGTVVLLLNIYRIICIDIFKLVISNAKYSKYIQIVQFSIFLDYSLIFTFKYIQIKHFLTLRRYFFFFTCHLDTVFGWMKIYLKDATWQFFSNNSNSKVMIASSNAQIP